MLDFTAEQRAIFEYNDGIKVVKADPLEIRRRIIFTLPNVSQLMREHHIGEQMLAMKERQVYRIAVAMIIYESLKTEAATLAGIAEIVREDEKFLRAVLGSLVAGKAVECNDGNYRSVESEEATAYIAAEEDKAKMTPEEASPIRFGKKAEETLVNGYRSVFMMDVDEETKEGPTDAMVWAVFRHWQEWLQKKSGKVQETPTSSTSSAG